VRGYVRYVDDFVLLADSAEALIAQRKAIDVFLRDHLALEVHPNKTVMQRCTQGLDFLGAIVCPHHKLTRQRSVRALRQRLLGLPRWCLRKAGQKLARSLGRPADKACGNDG
jgi:hypothetical protein